MGHNDPDGSTNKVGSAVMEGQMDRNKLGSKEAHHGRTAAAWASSAIALLGVLVATVGFLFGPDGVPSINVPVSIVGIGMLLIAPVVGGILNKAGLGQDG